MFFVSTESQTLLFLVYLPDILQTPQPLTVTMKAGRPLFTQDGLTRQAQEIVLPPYFECKNSVNIMLAAYYYSNLFLTRKPSVYIFSIYIYIFKIHIIQIICP